jgi:F-type H+-transporting ATPase subunit a
VNHYLHYASEHLALGKITIGDHAEATKLFGLQVNWDIVWSTLLAGAFVIWLGLRMAKRATSGVPSKLQLFYEMVTEQIRELTDSVIGPEGRQFVPLALTLFLFILVCNWIEVIPSGHGPDWLPAPTSDINLPLAMALTVFVWSNAKAFKNRGFVGYWKHFAQPYGLMTPINLIEEITKPVTMTFRLFGNIFAGGLMVFVMVALLPPYVYFFPEMGWKLFDMFIGAIQAFIFALLTIMYMGMAMSKEGH